MISHILGFTLIACAITGLSFVPFINFLYKIKMNEGENSYRRKDALGANTPIFNSIKKGKIGTPLGGGILIVLATSICFLIASIFLKVTLLQMISTLGVFLSFAAIGFLDDIKKIYTRVSDYVNLPYLAKLFLQIVVAGIFSYFFIESEIFRITFPYYFSELPIFISWSISTLLIVFMCNAFNITDGVDGLSAGLLLLALGNLAILAFFINAPLYILLFISILFGATLPYLYFNISPARIFMGDTGALAFGAILAFFALATDTWFLLPIWGLIFVIEAFSSQLQLLSKAVLKRKILPIAPLHHFFEYIGWSESKVTFRFWIFGIFLSLVNLFVFFTICGRCT